MSARWLVLADDLTGAADAAITFARRGLRTEVTWGEHPAGDFNSTDVLAYDCDSRRLDAAAAAGRHRAAAARYLPADANTGVYKKIDSTLRGQPAAEIAALLDALPPGGHPKFGIFAPANPAMGRTTRDGCVFVHGEPLESTEIWAREHSYPSADLAQILASASLHTLKLPLGQVRAGGAALRAALTVARAAASNAAGTILICDAETAEDLASIVAAASDSGRPALFIGTAGLANALAESMPRGSAHPAATAISRHGALIVVGSLASIARAAAGELAKLDGVRHVRFTIAMLLGSDAAMRTNLALDVRAMLERGLDVLVEMPSELAPDLSVGPALVHALANCLTPALSCMSGLIATGGETAAALLRQCYVGRIRLVDEIDAGIALGLMVGRTSIPLITKPGAFGDARSLIRSLERVRSIRQTGTVA